MAPLKAFELLEMSINTAQHKSLQHLRINENISNVFRLLEDNSPYKKYN